MNLNVKPSKRLKGSVWLPGSKSYSIRAFIIAACGGLSTINHPSDCDDALVAIHVAKQLGAKMTKNREKYSIIANRRGRNLRLIDVKESGTVLRFILPLTAIYAQSAKITGKGTLRGRPNHHLTKTLRKMGLKIRGVGRKESIPLMISGGRLSGGELSIDGSLSSQFISALLISAAQLGEDSRLSVTGPKMVSTDYIRMTISVLQRAGVKIKTKGSRKFIIKGRQQFKGLKDFDVPSDLGLAAFLLAAGSLVDSDIKLKGNFDQRLIQADHRILPFLKRMGVRFKKTKDTIKLKGPFSLKGGTFSLKDCPDLVPIMAVLALFAKGQTKLVDIAHARSKESNRISDLRSELIKVGANIKEREDALIVTPKSQYRSDARLDPHKDHRLAMAFTVLGLKLGCRVKDIECVSKSYPAFVKDLRSLGAGAQPS